MQCVCFALANALTAIGAEQIVCARVLTFRNNKKKTLQTFLVARRAAAADSRTTFHHYGRRARSDETDCGRGQQRRPSHRPWRRTDIFALTGGGQSHRVSRFAFDLAATAQRTHLKLNSFQQTQLARRAPSLVRIPPVPSVGNKFRRVLDANTTAQAHARTNQPHCILICEQIHKTGMTTVFFLFRRWKMSSGQHE